MISITKQKLIQPSGSLIGRIASKVRLMKNSKERLFQDALIRAYTTWAPQNWEWVDYSFNEHFLTHRVAPMLTVYSKGGIQPDPVSLANIWAEQFTWFDEEMKQRHISALIPAAATFLRYLETEAR